jgi:hypothetical protein
VSKTDIDFFSKKEEKVFFVGKYLVRKKQFGRSELKVFEMLVLRFKC